MSLKHKIALNELLVSRGLFASTDLASRAILAGEVCSGSGVLTSACLKVDPKIELCVKPVSRFVSRGGDKLAGALSDFCLDVSGLDCLDVGASTGGFTDCLLKSGAAHVTSVDVAYGQFAWQLRGDKRVTLYERTNIWLTDAQDIGGAFDLVVADVSFTALSKLVLHLKGMLKNNGVLLALIKPQFELKPSKVEKGGIVRDFAAHKQAIDLVCTAVREADMALRGLTNSKLKGPKGNIEFFLMAQMGAEHANIDIDLVVSAAHKNLL